MEALKAVASVIAGVLVFVAFSEADSANWDAAQFWLLAAIVCLELGRYPA